MRKWFLVFGACLYVFHGLSQDAPINNVLTDRHEIKINGLSLVLGAIEADYQYILNEESALGLDVLFAFDDETLSVNYFFAPYYRQYFGKRIASGFFVEGFGMLNSTNDYLYSYNEDAQGFYYDGNYTDVTDFALGIGTGVKFLTNKGFVLEIDLGVGRNLFKSDRDFKIIAKGGISLGYRF